MKNITFWNSGESKLFIVSFDKFVLLNELLGKIVSNSNSFELFSFCLTSNKTMLSLTKIYEFDNIDLIQHNI